MFAVVEFLNSEMESTGEISIVPLIWLLKNKTKCYWPIRTNKVPFRKFVEDLTPFKKSWPTYKVNTRFTCATYELAENQLKKILADNHESAESVRTLTQKGILNDSNSSTDSVQNPCIETVPAKKMRWEDDCALASTCSTPSLVNEEASTSSTTGDRGKSPAPSSIFSISSEGGRNVSISRNAEFESVVLNTLSKISTCVDQHSIILAELNRRASLAGSELLVPPECIMSENFPFQTLSSFQEFENKLTDKVVWEYMVRRLASLGGSGTEGLTRRMLRYLISDNVAKLFNWKGRDKIAFEKFKTKELLLEAVKITFPSKEIDEFRICGVMKEWLKFASARLKKTST